MFCKVGKKKKNQMGDGRRVLCDVQMEVVVTAVMVLGLLVAAVPERDQARAHSPAGRHSVRKGDLCSGSRVPLSCHKFDAPERVDIHASTIHTKNCWVKRGPTTCWVISTPQKWVEC